MSKCPYLVSVNVNDMGCPANIRMEKNGHHLLKIAPQIDPLNCGAPSVARGPFQKCLWALKSNSSHIFTTEYNTHLSMHGLDILYGISKGTFEIPFKISYPHIERYNFSRTMEFLGFLYFGPPDTENSIDYNTHIMDHILLHVSLTPLLLRKFTRRLV